MKNVVNVPKQKINKFWFKITFVFIYKSFTKRGRSTIANGWKRQKVVMISSTGTIRIFGANACTIFKKILTCANACTWHNHVNGGGGRFEAISENL